MVKELSLVSIGLLTGIAFSAVLPLLIKETGSPREIKDGINAAKSGDYSQARSILEGHLDVLDKPGAAMLADLYVEGLGGSIEDEKAAFLLRIFECSGIRMGEDEFSFAKKTRHKNPARATRWLIRSGEAGYPKAIELLTSAEKLKTEGFDQSLLISSTHGNFIPDEKFVNFRNSVKCKMD